MNKGELLQKSVEFLDSQMSIFEQGIQRDGSGPHVADEMNVAFLQTDEAIVSPAIEQAVEHFIRDGAWPLLDRRQYLHLMLRAYSARGAILAVLDGLLKGDQLISQMAPVGERFVRWAFIESWRMGGKAFLTALSNDFLKNKPAVSRAT